MQYKLIFSALLSTLLLGACIGEDFLDDRVEPRLRLGIVPDTLAVGDEFQLVTRFTNNVGIEEEHLPIWSSSDEEVITVSTEGLATARDSGSATITGVISYEGIDYSVDKTIEVGDTTIILPDNPVRRGSIMPSSFYDLEGEFTLTKVDENLILSFGDDYVADRGLPGLYLYLTNNPRSTQGAMEVGMVRTFSGAHDITIPGDIELDQYSHLLYFCKPFNVKVGDGLIEE